MEKKNESGTFAKSDAHIKTSVCDTQNVALKYHFFSLIK